MPSSPEEVGADAVESFDGGEDKGRTSPSRGSQAAASAAAAAAAAAVAAAVAGAAAAVMPPVATQGGPTARAEETPVPPLTPSSQQRPGSAAAAALRGGGTVHTRCDWDEAAEAILNRGNRPHMLAASGQLRGQAEGLNGSGALALPERVRQVGDHDSMDSHEITISHLHRRQAEWDRQMEFHDQKQAELLTIQWKLVREQTGTLARELGIVQQQLKELKIDSRKALVEVDRHYREYEAKFTEEHNHRLALEQSIEQRFKKARQDLEAESKLRSAADLEVLPKLGRLEELIDSRNKDTRSHLDLELGKLRKDVEGCVQEIDALKEALEQEAAERRAQDEAAMELLREVRDQVQKDGRDRATLHEEHLRSQLAVIEREKQDRCQAYTALEIKLANLQQDIAPQREELPALRARLQEVEGLMTSRLKESQKGLERELAERAAVQQKLERRVSDLFAASEKEHAARTAQVEEYEQQLKIFRNKVNTRIGEQAELARQAREEMQAQLTEQLEREAALREAQASTLQDLWNGHRAAFDVRVDALEGSLSLLEQRWLNERSAETHELEVSFQKHSEAMARQMREQGDLLLAKLAEERSLRETADSSIEEHMDFLDRFLQDVREVFMQKGSRSTRQLVSRRPGSSTRAGDTASSPTPSLALGASS